MRRASPTSTTCWQRGERFLVQVFVHVLEQRREAAKLAVLFDAAASKRGFRTLARRIARGTTLTFELRVPGLEVDEPVESPVWNGRPESVQFGVAWGRSASRTALGPLIGTVTVRRVRSLLLFWSRAARESAWVLKEVRYALARKQGSDDAPPEIKPVILEGPPIVPPPPELASLHFNDRLLYFMNAGRS